MLSLFFFSPVLVDADSDLSMVASRVISGKAYNAGQVGDTQYQGMLSGELPWTIDALHLRAI